MWLFTPEMGWREDREGEAFRLLLQAIGSSNVTEASLFVQGMKSDEDWKCALTIFDTVVFVRY
jgi:hypothetical protein